MSAVSAQPEQVKRIWRPVRQQAADSFLILTIAAFAATVIVVRVFLQLSGYPQVGSSVFHVAHLLWGGLLLFVALVLMLVWANHWVMWLAALMGGIGIGLFIDEVGKFITQSNDYFFPLAFPIIYAFLLACVWFYLRVRRTRPRDARTLLYQALEDMKQVLDHDLDPFERTDLVNGLNLVLTKTPNPNEKRLALALLEYVRAEETRLAAEPNAVERTWVWIKFIAARWPTRRTFKWILILGFGWIGISALLQLGALLALVNGYLRASPLPEFVIQNGKETYAFANPTLVMIHSVAIIATGVMALIAAGLMLMGRERQGLRLGTFALVVSLTVVTLLTFYLSQLYAIVHAISQLLLLMAATFYRWRFFTDNK